MGNFFPFWNKKFNIQNLKHFRFFFSFIPRFDLFAWDRLFSWLLCFLSAGRMLAWAVGPDECLAWRHLGLWLRLSVARWVLRPSLWPLWCGEERFAFFYCPAQLLLPNHILLQLNSSMQLKIDKRQKLIANKQIDRYFK